jgi:hypothetical protein
MGLLTGMLLAMGKSAISLRGAWIVGLVLAEVAAVVLFTGWLRGRGVLPRFRQLAVVAVIIFLSAVFAFLASR